MIYSGLHFGSYGLKALESGRISNKQIESARRAITRKMAREGVFGFMFSSYASNI